MNLATPSHLRRARHMQRMPPWSRRPVLLVRLQAATWLKEPWHQNVASRIMQQYNMILKHIPFKAWWQLIRGLGKHLPHQKFDGSFNFQSFSALNCFGNSVLSQDHLTPLSPRGSTNAPEVGKLSDQGVLQTPAAFHRAVWSTNLVQLGRSKHLGVLHVLDASMGPSC